MDVGEGVAARTKPRDCGPECCGPDCGECEDCVRCIENEWSVE